MCARVGKLLLRRAVVSEDAGSPDYSPGSGWTLGPRIPETSVVETRSEKSGDDTVTNRCAEFHPILAFRSGECRALFLFFNVKLLLLVLWKLFS